MPCELCGDLALGVVEVLVVDEGGGVEDAEGGVEVEFEVEGFAVVAGAVEEAEAG